MMARRVWRQRPQSAPAPHAVATCLDVTAPFATASATISVVAPLHRHTNMITPPLLTRSLAFTMEIFRYRSNSDSNVPFTLRST
jgi:hypothetical protein